MLKAGDRVQVLRRPWLLVGGAGEPREARRHRDRRDRWRRRGRIDPGSSQRTTPASGWLRGPGSRRYQLHRASAPRSPIRTSGVRSPSPSRPSTGTTASGRYCTCWVFTYPTPHGSLRPRRGPSKTTSSHDRRGDERLLQRRHPLVDRRGTPHRHRRRRRHVPRSSRAASATRLGAGGRRGDQRPADLHLGRPPPRTPSHVDDAGGDRGAHPGVARSPSMDPDPGVDASHAVDEQRSAPARSIGVGTIGRPIGQRLARRWRRPARTRPRDVDVDRRCRTPAPTTRR